MTEYNQKYCIKHNQHFAWFLHECPICVGEQIRMEELEHERTLHSKKEEDKGV